MCLAKKEMYIFFVQCMVIWLKAIESGPMETLRWVVFSDNEAFDDIS